MRDQVRLSCALNKQRKENLEGLQNRKNEDKLVATEHQMQTTEVKKFWKKRRADQLHPAQFTTTMAKTRQTHSSQKMISIFSSGTSVPLYSTTMGNIPEDQNRCFYSHEKLNYTVCENVFVSVKTRTSSP